MWMRGLDFQARDLLFNHLQYKQQAINVFVQLSLASLGFCAARSDHMQNREGSTKLEAYYPCDPHSSSPLFANTAVFPRHYDIPRDLCCWYANMIWTYVHTTFTVHFQELHFTYFEHLFLMVHMTNALNGCRIWKAAMMIMQLHLKVTSPAFSHFFLLISIFYSCLSVSLLRVFLCLFRHPYLFLVLLLFSTCQQRNRKPCHASCLT